MKSTMHLSPRKRKLLIGLVLAWVAVALVVQLFNFLNAESEPSPIFFGALSQEGLKFTSADLVTKRDEVYVVVTLESPEGAMRTLRPGRRAYAFDQTGRLQASTGNDVDDPEFYLEWEDQQKRPLTEEEIAALSKVTGLKFAEIVSGWRRVAATR